MALTNAEKQQYQERLTERFRAAELRQKKPKRCKLKRAQSSDTVRAKDKEKQLCYQAGKKARKISTTSSPACKYKQSLNKEVKNTSFALPNLPRK